MAPGFARHMPAMNAPKWLPGAGPVMAFMTGNLFYEIEHHLYPDLPSNRLAEIAVRVRQLCEKYDLPYTTGSLLVQYGKAWGTIAKLSLPNKCLSDSADEPNPQRKDVRRARAGIRRDPPGNRPSSRLEDRDGDGAAVAAA